MANERMTNAERKEFMKKRRAEKLQKSKQMDRNAAKVLGRMGRLDVKGDDYVAHPRMNIDKNRIK